jgi:hypothetical protein
MNSYSGGDIYLYSYRDSIDPDAFCTCNVYKHIPVSLDLSEPSAPGIFSQMLPVKTESDIKKGKL